MYEGGIWGDESDGKREYQSMEMVEWVQEGGVEEGVEILVDNISRGD